MTSLIDLGLSESDFWSDEKLGDPPITTWDLLYMAGEIWPGIWTIEVSKGIDVEVVKTSAKIPNKLVDPTITDKGYRPGRVKAIGEIWTSADWGFLQQLLPFIVPSQSTTPRDAYDISHPALYLLGISSVIVLDVRLPPIKQQTLTVEIDLMEWFPQTAAKTPAAIKNLRPNSKPLNEADFIVPVPTADGNL